MKGIGIVVVLLGLVLLSGVDASSFTLRAAWGDAMFPAAVIVSFSALVTCVPAYFVVTGSQRLIAIAPSVFWTDVPVQGVIAGAGTPYTCAKMVSLLGPARAAVFPGLAPGLAALMAWPVSGHTPAAAETPGLLVAMAGLIVAVTAASRR